MTFVHFMSCMFGILDSICNFSGDILRLCEDMTPNRFSMLPFAAVVLSTDRILPSALILGILLQILYVLSDKAAMDF